MPSILIDEFDAMRHLKIGAFTVGIRVKTPVDHDTSMKGLTNIQKTFPELSESSFDSDSKTFKLKNDESDYDHQIIFQFENFMDINLSWGANSQFSKENHIDKMFETIENSFNIFPINIEWIDFKLIIIANVDCNHFTSIWESFIGKSPLYNFFEPERVTQNNLTFRSLITDDTACLLSFYSNVTDIEVIKKKYKDDTLKISIGIAKIRNIPVGEKLYVLMGSHLDYSVNFLKQKIKNCFLAPLDSKFPD